MKVFALLFGISASLFCGAAGAQTTSPVEQGVLGAPDLAIDPLGPGDLISIYIANLPESTRSYRVSADGTISLPMLKAPLPVGGLLTADIEKALAKSLVNERVLVNPIVSVGVLQYRSRTVTVAGSVNQPGTVQAIGHLRLLQVIAKAGGLSADAGPEILVSKPTADGTPAEVSHISVKNLLQQSDPSLNMSLSGGEEVRVPAASRIYIVGNVHTPGTYPINETQGLSVMKALALCQGALSFSQEKAYVYRPTESGRQEIVVPLRNIMKRRAADIQLQANDVFYVPDSSGKRLSATILDRMAGFSASTVAGLVIYGR